MKQQKVSSFKQVCGCKPAGVSPYEGALLHSLNTIELATGLWLIMETNSVRPSREAVTETLPHTDVPR